MITLRIIPPLILVNNTEWGDETFMERVYEVENGIKYDKRMKAFKLTFGVEALQALKRVFPDCQVTQGQQYIEKLKVDVKNLANARNNFGKLPPPSQQVFKEPFLPKKHQEEGLWYLHNFEGGALFADCGCIVSDSIISYSRAKLGKKLTIEEMYKRFPTWRTDIQTYVRSLCGDTIRLNPIEKIVQSGIKEVWRMELEDGKFLEATFEHPVFTKNGEIPLGSLTLGIEVMVDNLTKHKRTSTLVKEKKKQDKRIAVGSFHPYARKQMSHQGRSHSYLLEIHRAIFEAKENKMSLEDFVKRTYKDVSNMIFVDPKMFSIHHKDGNHYNNDPENLMKMTNNEHAKFHSKGYTNFKHGVPEFSKVKSIHYVGYKMTYDIICKDPYRNFVANGIVIHNSGKSAMTLWDIEAKIHAGTLKRGKALIACKMMTMLGWADEVVKFTNLTSEVLWVPSKSKNEKSDVVIVADHGPKPPGEAKTFNKTEYYFHSGAPAIIEISKFDSRRHVRKVRSWKQVGDQKYGKETLSTIEIRNLKAEEIQRRLRESTADVFVINHDGILHFEDELAGCGFELITVDESTVIKNPKSKLFESLLRISQRSSYRRILSGTPSPQGPEDLWSQMYFLDGGITLGPDYKQFLLNHFEMINLGDKDKGTYVGTKYLVSPPHKKNTVGWVNSRLQNRVFRCKLRDCVDLPPISIDRLDVFLTPELETHYESMKEALCVTTRDGEQIDVTVELAKIGKLRQITGGFILNKEGEVVKLAPTNPKLETLKEYLSELPEDEKVVIFAVFKCEIAMLKELFGKSCVTVCGDDSDAEKVGAPKRFIEDPSIKYIIIQPQSGAYGVNGLTIARYLIFYSLDFRADCHYQAIKRIERTGQLRAMIVKYLLARGTIDDAIYKAVYKKENTQQKLIDLEVLRELKGGTVSK